MSQGPGGPPRWPPGSGLPPGHPANHRSPSPFRGPPPPRPGWASPIPPRMTQSPPPFLIRPMVGGQHRDTASPFPVPSPVPFMPPPPRWSPSPVPGGKGTPIPPNFNHPHPPHPLMAPRPFFRPITPSPTPPPMHHHMGHYSSTPPPPQQHPPQSHQHPSPSHQYPSPSHQHHSPSHQRPSPSHQHPQSQNMTMSPDPEIFNLQPSYDVEFVYPPGMEPDSLTRRRMTPLMSIDDEEGGLTTAEIIAAQSQDYVDERLAEYQATIQHLQGFQISFSNSFA